MKHEEEPLDDYNKRMKEYINDIVKQEIVSLGEEKKRDYKKEYAKYGSSTKAKKYRAELNKYNRKKGTYGNGDGKDASHKGGKIVGFESQSKNRGRAEKSRLKKEDIKEKSIPHANPNYNMEKTMQKLAKSLGIKSVVSMYTGSGSLSYFLDDDREAKKLQKFLKRSFKRVRLIPLDKSKGDDANWVVAADMLGFESINESEQDKIKQYLMKKGDNEKDATEKLKYYDMVSKMYKGANSTKKAEIMSSLWANENVAPNHDGKSAPYGSGYEEMDEGRSIKENLIPFYKYMGDFYGKKGIYPDKKGRDLKVGDINKALSVYLKKYSNDTFTGDSIDRERIRDILIKMRKLDPDYSKKESVNEGVSQSQAQEIMKQLGGRKFEMLMGVKSKGIGKDGLILHIGRNSKRVSHIIIDLDRGRDLYNLTFGKIYKYQFKVIKKLKGIYVDQLHDMIEKYTGLYTTFGSRR